jgi:hypothetical protein
MHNPTINTVLGSSQSVNKKRAQDCGQSAVVGEKLVGGREPYTLIFLLILFDSNIVNYPDLSTCNYIQKQLKY